jgi:asparagine synthase (glutamine-hydrolysing)
MCGLVGIWRRDGAPADQSVITKMLRSIEHRGPDGSGVWQDERVTLGHLRLSIIDLTKASHQPMVAGNDAGVLVYNGEVYNFRELRQELEREGVTFRSSGDTEVVLQALHHWGPERSVARFDGMFAFAYFDRRENALWLARDRVGIKPLVLTDTGTELLFASEAKALLAHPRVKKRVDRHAITCWLLSGGRGWGGTSFSAIEELEPGCLWKITDDGIDKKQYFHALTAVQVNRVVNTFATKPADFVGAFRDCLKRSVRLHLASDAPLAALCSGGVDSSLVAAYAQDQLPNLEAYVADVLWPGGEGAQAARVARHLSLPIDRVIVDRARFLELWPLAVWHSDYPPTHPSDLALLAVAQKCRASGIKVLLTGEGSDELFGGYEWQKATYDIWSQAASWRRHFSTGRNLRKHLSNFPFSTERALFSVHPAIDPRIGRMAGAKDVKRLRQRLTVALHADSELLPQRLLALLAPVEPEADRAFLAHCLWSLYGQLQWLLHRHDRMGMAASIEMRVPFLQNEMFDFAFHLPRRAKLHNGTGKWLVKQAAAEILPADVVYAKKQGFPMPSDYSRGTGVILVNGTLAELMEWPRNTVGEIVAMLADTGGLRFQVVGLELWARIFFNGEAPAELGERLTAMAFDHR